MSEEEEWRLFIKDATVKLAFKMLMISISQNSYLSREMDTERFALSCFLPTFPGDSAGEMTRDVCK
jgi:hypothetical protein